MTQPEPKLSLPPMGGSLPRTLRMHNFLEMFVQMRWGAGLCALLAVAGAEHILRIGFPYPYLYSTVLAIFAYNAVFFVLLRATRVPVGVLDHDLDPGHRKKRILALAQINSDFAALFFLLHFSGGLENPFNLFFLFHVVIAGIILEPHLVWAEALLAAALPLLLGVSEKTGLLTHYHAVEVLGPTEIVDKWSFVLTMPAVLAVTIFVLTAVTVAIVGRHAAQRNQLIALKRDLEEKNHELLRMDELRRRMLAVASHDLKAPVSAAMSSLFALRDGYVGELTDRQTDLVNRSLRRLEGLGAFVNDILNVHAIERGKIEGSMEPCDLGALLSGVVANWQDSAAEKGVALELSIRDPLPPVECAAARITQVFENLLSNALKYTPAGGRVEVTAEEQGEEALVAVADSGIGISEHDAKHLFEDFFRADVVRGKFEGTGLGLSVVERIIRVHHGTITAASELGRGTTFTVRLPLEYRQSLVVDTAATIR